jgi:hypothetical protein
VARSGSRWQRRDAVSQGLDAGVEPRGRRRPVGTCSGRRSKRVGVGDAAPGAHAVRARSPRRAPGSAPARARVRRRVRRHSCAFAQKGSSPMKLTRIIDRLDRRRALGLLGALGASAAVGCGEDDDTLAPAEAAGALNGWGRARCRPRNAVVHSHSRARRGPLLRRREARAIGSRRGRDVAGRDERVTPDPRSRHPSC